MHAQVAEALLLLLGDDTDGVGETGVDTFVRQYKGTPMLWFALCQKLEAITGLDLSTRASSEDKAIVGFVLKVVRQMLLVAQAAAAAIISQGQDVRDMADMMHRRRRGDDEGSGVVGAAGGGGAAEEVRGRAAASGAGENTSGEAGGSNEQVFAQYIKAMSVTNEDPYGATAGRSVTRQGVGGGARSESLLRASVHLLTGTIHARGAPTAGGAARVRGVGSYEAMQSMSVAYGVGVEHTLVPSTIDEQRVSLAEQALAHPAFCLKWNPEDLAADPAEHAAAENAAMASGSGPLPIQDDDSALRSLGWLALALVNNSRVWLALQTTTQAVKRVQSERVRAEEAMLTFFVQHMNTTP
jgi:hypothetical protein